MDYDKNAVDKPLSFGSRDGKPKITHLRIFARQTIRFNNEEAEILKDDIFDLLKEFNCELFLNLKGVSVTEEKILETSDPNSQEVKKAQNELSEKVVKNASRIFEILKDHLEKE